MKRTKLWKRLMAAVIGLAVVAASVMSAMAAETDGTAEAAESTGGIQLPQRNTYGDWEFAPGGSKDDVDPSSDFRVSVEYATESAEEKYGVYGIKSYTNYFTLEEYRGDGGRVVIPDGIDIISGGAFNGFEDKIAELVFESDDFVLIENSAFSAVYRDVTPTLEFVDFGCSNIGIGDKAFEGCVNLKRIDFGKDAVKISGSAFEGCANLSEVNLTDGEAFNSDLDISTNAFSDTPFYESCYQEDKGMYIFENVLLKVTNDAVIETDGKLVIPDGVNVLASCMCDDVLITNTYGITDVVFPDGVTRIPDYCFGEMCGIDRLVVPDGVTYIGNLALADYSWSIGTIYIPNSVTHIGCLGTDTIVEGEAGSYAEKWTNGKSAHYKYSFVDVVTPETPGVAQTSKATTGVKLSWKKATRAVGYEVQRRAYGSTVFKTVKTTSGLSFADAKLTSGTYYQYRVRAYGYRTDGSTVYGAWSKVLTANTSLAAPASVKTSSPKAGQATVSWKKVTGATGYQVYRATSKNGKYTKIATAKTAKYTDKKASSKKTYYYKVRAYKTVKGKSAIFSGWSSVKGVKVK